MGRRVPRLNEQLRREVTEILRYQVKDPRVGFVTVNRVSASADLMLARVFVSVLGEEAEKQESLEGLTAAAPFIRSELSKRLRIRRVPELEFRLDRSLDHLRRVEELLEEAAPPPADQGEGALLGSSEEEEEAPPGSSEEDDA